MQGTEYAPLFISSLISCDHIFSNDDQNRKRYLLLHGAELARRGSTSKQSIGPFNPLTELRQVTANIHESLHHHPDFARLMRGILSLTEYLALLARLYGFYFPLENLLRMTAPAISPVCINAREKAHLLHADLVSLGLSRSVISTVPMRTSFPPIRSQENVVGCLYVIEGAGRDGNVMARKLDYLLGPEIAAGRSFLIGRTAPDPFPWEAFCELLETCAEWGNFDEIIGSARGTFSAFSLWLNTGGAHV
jgi:heme oxygenase